MKINYQIEQDLSAMAFKELLIKSSLGNRRPIEDFAKITSMIKNANLIITARDKNQLVGVARSITDQVYCTYLSDLAVDSAYQKQGIGKELIKKTKFAAPQAKLILLSAPRAVTYYPKIGMTQWKQCYILDDVASLV